MDSVTEEGFRQFADKIYATTVEEATRNGPAASIWPVFHIFNPEKIGLFCTFLKKFTFFHPSLLLNSGILKAFSVKMHGKQPLRGAPFGKFKNQNLNFRLKLGLDSIAVIGLNLAVSKPCVF